MRNSACVICLTEFKPREGKLYCSNACKQKGYADKKNESIGAKTNEQIESKDQEERKSKKQFTIYFPEYEKYCKDFPKSFDSFPLFCFFRKNWTGVFDSKKFNAYIESLGDSFWEDFWDDHGHNDISPARKKYNEFQEKFFGSDEFIVDFNEKEN